MLQISTTSFEKFKKLQGIKDSPGEIEKKLWKQTYRYIPILRYIPSVLFVGIGNSLSMNACHKNSDIDIFIITRKNRIWITRIIVTVYFSLLGLRKTARKHAGKFCLSFFITENALDLSKIPLKNDIYLYFWILYLTPIVDKDNTYEKFIDVNSLWCDFSQYKNTLSKKNNIYTSKNYNIPYFFTSFGNIIEKMLKIIFLPRTKKRFEKLGKPFGVIITHDMLKFHNNDQRKNIQNKLL